MQVEVWSFESHRHYFFIEEVGGVAEDVETAGEEGGGSAWYRCVFDVDGAVVEGGEDDAEEVGGLCAVAIVGRLIVEKRGVMSASFFGSKTNGRIREGKERKGEEEGASIAIAEKVPYLKFSHNSQQK